MSRSQILEIPPLTPHGKGYRITFEKQDASKEKKALSKKDADLLSSLYVQVQEDPKTHIGKLEQLSARCGAVPEIANLLAFALLQTGKRKEAELLIEKTWAEHPDYLIGKINYADQALRQGKKERVASIFSECFDLGRLYPERDTFHFSEFRGFMVVMGFYHLAIGEKEKAEEYYQLAFQVDPLHPSISTLEKALSRRSILKEILGRIRALFRDIPCLVD